MKPVALCVLVFAVMVNAADPGFENSARFRPLNHLFRVRRDVDEKCEPGSKIMRECNECTCNNDGTRLACTRMACPDIPEEYKNPDGSWKSPAEIAQIEAGRPKREVRTLEWISTFPNIRACKPGSSRTVECNTCTCVPDGSTEVCTKKACHPAERRRREALHCKPNSHFMNECNNCICSSDGRDALCTMMACPPRGFERKSAIDNDPRQK